MKAVIKKSFLFILAALTVLLWGNYIGSILPHEIPPINSVITEKLLEAQNNMELSGYYELKNKKGLTKMFVTYNLAALESSYERTPDLKNDILLFFDIALALPEDSEITMFRFQKDHIELDYSETGENTEIFCNNLAKTGKFTKINYEELEKTSKITLKRMPQ